MIARGSRDEHEARRHIAAWRGLLGHWNGLADDYRRIARGDAPATSMALEEADTIRRQIAEALERCDTLTDNLAPGHEFRSELYQIASGLEALNSSIGFSAELMGPRVEAARDVAGLKFLVAAIRRDGGLDKASR